MISQQWFLWVALKKKSLFMQRNPLPRSQWAHDLANRTCDSTNRHLTWHSRQRYQELLHLSKPLCHTRWVPFWKDIKEEPFSRTQRSFPLRHIGTTDQYFSSYYPTWATPPLKWNEGDAQGCSCWFRIISDSSACSPSWWQGGTMSPMSYGTIVGTIHHLHSWGYASQR